MTQYKDAPPPRARLGTAPRLRRLMIAALVAVVLAFAASFVPIPIFYEFLPGPVRDVEQLVEVRRAKTYSSEGKLFLTTVKLDPRVTATDMLAALFDSRRKVVPRAAVDAGGDLKQLERQQRLEMAMSKRQAEQVVLGELGLASGRGSGARVTETLPDLPAHRALRAGDVIVSASGRRVSSTCDVIRAVTERRIGEEIRFTLRRQGRLRQVAVRTVESPTEPGVPFIGVAMEEVDFRFASPVRIRFTTGKVAGPSAGLMLALALYDRLTAEDLTKGREVAGTGTIRCDGDIGAIGGVEQKVAGAEAAGADVFLAPKANVEAARRVARDVEVVPVGSFDDALKYLEAL